MPVEFQAKRTIGGLIPVDANAEREMLELPMGKDIKVVCTVARSNPQNSWFHVVLWELFDNQETWPTRPLFKRKIKEALGCGEYYEVKGKMYFEPTSIAFHKMKGTEFNQFVDGFVKLVETRILPHFDEQAVRAMFELLDANTGVLGERITK